MRHRVTHANAPAQPESKLTAACRFGSQTHFRGNAPFGKLFRRAALRKT
jgi:hypothetical protein